MTYATAAGIYDLVYARKDYAADAAMIRAIVADRCPRAKTLLDVACATGRHLELLRRWYSVEGLDIEPALLEIARRRLPDVPLHRADMRTFELGRKFDVVTCLFSSIGYMQTPDDLAAALTAMARHLVPAGVLLIEPWLSPDAFDPQHIGGPVVAEEPGLVVVRMNGSRVEGRLSVLEFHHLVGRRGEVEHFVETHALALHTRDEYATAFGAAGLRAEYDPEGLMGRGLWIAQASAT